METMTNTTGGPDSPREIVERMIDILRGALDADRLDDLGARLALVVTIAWGRKRITSLRSGISPEMMDAFRRSGPDVQGPISRALALTGEPGGTCTSTSCPARLRIRASASPP